MNTAVLNQILNSTIFIINNWDTIILTLPAEMSFILIVNQALRNRVVLLFANTIAEILIGTFNTIIKSFMRLNTVWNSVSNTSC